MTARSHTLVGLAAIAMYCDLTVDMVVRLHLADDFPLKRQGRRYVTTTATITRWLQQRVEQERKQHGR